MSACPDARPGLDRSGVLVREITAALAATGHTLSVAESLTAGRLCQVLADAPGASATFRGGVVVYASELKASLLGVDTALLDRVGAVHPEVAARMAEGVRRLARTTYGLATTGVAGPAPQDGRDVGTVYVAVATDRDTLVDRPRKAAPDRQAIQEGAVLAALEQLRDRLRPPS